VLVTNPPVALTDKLWMLGTAAYPLYLVKGPHAGAIFEGGTSPMGPLLVEQLQQLGIARELVRQVVVTHGHPDHVMAVPLLRRMFPNVTVAASQVASQTMANEKAVAFFSQLDQALTGALLKAGAIGEQHKAEPLTEKTIAVDRIIKEGDTIEVDGLKFQVLETPGHSDCSLSFYEPAARVLLVSDASGYYLPAHDYWWPNYFGNYATYMASMRRLAGFDCEVLCLSHNAAIRGAGDVQTYFRRAIEATEQYHERILAEARAGKGVRQIAEELGSEVYQMTQLLPLDFFQKNCGLLVKHSLKHAGVSVEK